KWHFLSGIIALPFIVLLSATGIIYLFKDTYEHNDLVAYKKVEVTARPLTYQKQWEIAKTQTKESLSSMVIPNSTNQATEFVSGMFETHQSLYIDPYKGIATGLIETRNTDMYKVRKLH